ncbi:MAG: insulinase family protein [Acidobacteriota bacterium]|nr:insulinase family protein [Acidobacteriota bacterium]MDQ3420338.1 insulinase family protein [Acidobacteriota bacterium]
MIPATLAQGLRPVRTELANGVVILAQESGTVPAVTITATFFAGSAQDPVALPGVAYLTRRVIDRGAANRSAVQIADALDDRGVALRVTASRDTFSVACDCLSEDLDDLLGLVADVIREPLFPQVELDKRRIEAMTSVRQDDDNPAVRSIDALVATLYGPTHPYGRPFKGTLASLQSIGRDPLVEFHRQHLQPSSLRLAIVGDVDPAAAVEAGSRYFESWRGTSVEQDVLAAPPAARQRTIMRQVMPGKSQSDIGYGFTAVRRLDPRYYAYWMMNNILGQFGLGGRLADNIRERQGMAYYAYSTLEARVSEGPLIVRAGVDPNNVERTLDAIDKEVSDLSRTGPTLAEFEDTRQSLIGSIPRMLETNDGICEFLLGAEQFGLGLDHDRRLPGLLRAVTLAAVHEAAAEILDPSRASIVVAGPAE